MVGKMKKIFRLFIFVLCLWGSVGVAEESNNKKKLPETKETAQDVLDEIFEIVNNRKKAESSKEQDLQSSDENNYEFVHNNTGLFVGLEMSLLSNSKQILRQEGVDNVAKISISRFNADVLNNSILNFGTESEKVRFAFVISHTDVKVGGTVFDKEEGSKSMYGVKLDVFLGSYKKTKPFARLALGYAELEINDRDFGGGIFGLGLGINHYTSDSISVYLNAGYNFFPEKEIADTALRYEEHVFYVGMGCAYRF